MAKYYYEEVEKHRKIYNEIIKKIEPGDYLMFTSKSNKQYSFIFLIISFSNFTDGNIYSNVCCYKIGGGNCDPGLCRCSCGNIKEWLNQSAFGYVCELVKG